MRARQAVAFTVEEVLKGTVSEPTVTVYEPLVKASRLAAATAGPGASPILFGTGNRVIVFARRAADGTLDGVDENVGVIPFSPANLAAVKSLL